MPLLNYTTTINPIKTVAEIQGVLAKAGATRILIEYANTEPSGLAFEIAGVQYRLPCRAEAVYTALRRDANVPRRLTTEIQARRVAWRILKDWTEAQLAIIKTGMVEVQEVFLPYRLTSGGETVYQVMLRSDHLLTSANVLDE